MKKFIYKLHSNRTLANEQYHTTLLNFIILSHKKTDLFLKNQFHFYKLIKQNFHVGVKTNKNGALGIAD